MNDVTRKNSGTPDGVERRTRSSEAFFGRRHGKTLRPFQTALLENTLPAMLVNPANAFPSLENLFPGRAEKPFNLEIGFGGGEHLNAERLRLKDENFLGVEPFVNGMVKLLAAYEEAPGPNLRVYNDDATKILDWLPQGICDRVDLLYPDPWPKKKHFKRRFVNDRNLERIARVLKPGGLFRFASDIDSYQDWTLEHIARSTKFTWTAETADDWREPWPNWKRTRYEAKAYREGRKPGYFVFRRAD
jgi:tRNA (guanine-N7-)-methyltransferase